MDLKTRLLRKPFLSLLWSILVTATALMLGVGCALGYATMHLLPLLDESHTTVALRSDSRVEAIKTENGVSYTVIPKYFTAEDLELFQSLPSVKEVNFHKLTGAYVPEMSALLGYSYGYGGYKSDAYVGANEGYDSVLIIATVDAVQKPVPDGPRLNMQQLGLSQEEQGYKINLKLTPQQVLSAHPKEPVAMKSTDCFITVYGQGAVDFFQVGQTYLLCCQYSENGPYFVFNNYLALENDTLMGFSYSYRFTNEGIFGDVEIIGWSPRAVRVDGNLEEILSSGEVWAELLETIPRTHSHLPVIGTNNLDSMYQFHAQDITLSQGRKFTQEEYDTGAKVCLISEGQAQASGLQVGDSIHLSQFLVNESNNQSLRYALDGMLNNPGVGMVQEHYDYLTEAEPFTVVGIYRQKDQWGDSSASLNANTILIPQKAQVEGGFGGLSQYYEEEILGPDGSVGIVARWKEQGCFGTFFSMVLHNGMADDFALSIAGTQWETEFNIYDQGYGAVMDAMAGTAESARTLLLAAAAGWAVILALYVLLYQQGQRRNIGIMRSLGATGQQAVRYLFGSGWCLAAVGITAGTVLTAIAGAEINRQLLTIMVDKIPENQYSTGLGLTSEALTELVGRSQLPAGGLLALMGAQIAVFSLVLWLQALALSRKKPRKLMGV